MLRHLNNPSKIFFLYNIINNYYELQNIFFKNQFITAGFTCERENLLMFMYNCSYNYKYQYIESTRSFGSMPTKLGEFPQFKSIGYLYVLIVLSFSHNVFFPHSDSV